MKKKNCFWFVVKTAVLVAAQTKLITPFHLQDPYLRMTGKYFHPGLLGEQFDQRVSGSEAAVCANNYTAVDIFSMLLSSR